MTFKSYRNWLTESNDELSNIFSGAVWSNGNDYMHLEERGIKIYGCGNDFDFERNSKEEALVQLKKWGYHYVGAE